MCAKGIYDVQKSAHMEYSIKSKGAKYDAKIEYWILVRIFSFGLFDGVIMFIKSLVHKLAPLIF